MPLLLLAEPSRPFFGTGDSKEGGLFHTPLHEFFRRRLDGRKGAGGVGGWPGKPRQRLGQARAAEAGALRTQRPALPWECQALGVPSPGSAKPWECQGQRRCQRRRAIGGLGGGWREQPGRWQGGQWVRLSPWECQAAQSHQARAEGDMASMLRRPSPAPSSALYASSISSWLGLGLGLGVGLGLGLGLGLVCLVDLLLVRVRVRVRVSMPRRSPPG